MFGGRNPRPTPPPRQPPPPQTAGSYNRIPVGGPDASGVPPSYGRPLSGSQRPFYDGAPPEKHEYSRGQSDTSRMSGGARGRSGGQEWQLRPAKSPGNQFIFGNMYREPEKSVLAKRMLANVTAQSRRLAIRLPPPTRWIGLLHHTQRYLRPHCKAGRWLSAGAT